MGVMVLVLTPCLYCNVSDSWMLPNKWHRAAIGAAGMYVELVLASLATFIWWYSQPGLLNNLCLNVMFVCSVSTVVFNANPLLAVRRLLHPRRPDGDPQPAAEGHHDPQPQIGRVVPGPGTARGPLPPAAQPDLLRPLFGASAIYRWVVVFSILWFLYKFFGRTDLELHRPDDRHWRRCGDWWPCRFTKWENSFMSPGGSTK